MCHATFVVLLCYVVMVVWAWGVTLWELLAHEPPFQQLKNFQVAVQVANKGLRLQIRDEWPKQVCENPHNMSNCMSMMIK